MANQRKIYGGQNNQRGKMDEEDKKAIQENTILIEREVDGRHLASFLFAKYIITWGESEKVRQQDTRRSRTQTVLGIIFTRGPRAYSAFLAALDHENYRHVADAIRRTRQNNVSIETAGRGVTPYGKRLVNVENDVQKVKDDVQEIDHRVKQIEEDAGNEITVEQLQEEIQKLRIQEESSKNQIKILEEQLKEKDREIELLQEENKEKSERLLTLERERDEIKRKLQDLTETNKRLEEKIEQIENNGKEMEQKLEARDQQLEARDQQFEERMRLMEQRVEQSLRFTVQQPRRNIRSDSNRAWNNNFNRRNEKH